MSGDEWRISATIQPFRKGVVRHETHMRNVETACQFLGWLHCQATEKGDAYFAGEGDFCDQEGCTERGTVLLRKKRNYCREGHSSEVLPGSSLRLFCQRHSTRGDCGFDDGDANYEILYGGKQHEPADADKSPSQQIEIDASDLMGGSDD